MTDATPEPDLPAIDPEAYNDFVTRADLAGIVVTNIAASRTDPADPVRFALHAQTRVAPGLTSVDYQVVLGVQMVAEDDAPVAQIETTFVAQFTIADGHPVPENVFHGFSGEVIKMVWPYGRQGLQDLASRLGFPGLALGLLKQAPDGSKPSLDVKITMGPMPEPRPIS